MPVVAVLLAVELEGSFAQTLAVLDGSLTSAGAPAWTSPTT